jgi:WD40 repeat protein
MVASAWSGDEPSVRILDLRLERVVWNQRITDAADTAVSPGGNRIAVATHGKGAVFDVETGKREFELEGSGSSPEIPGQVSWSPDGRYLAMTSMDEPPRIYAETGTLVSVLSGHMGYLMSVAWSPRSPSPGAARLVTGGSEGAAKVWDVRGRDVKLVQSLSAPDMHGGVRGVAFSADGTRVMAGDDEFSAVKVWDVSRNGDAEWTNLRSSGSVVFTPDDRLVATTPDGTALAVWDVQSRREVLTIDPAAIGFINAVDVSPDGRMIAAGGWVRRYPDPNGEPAGAWDAATGRELFRVGHRLDVNDVAFSRDGEHVVTASWDGTAKIVDRSGRVIRVLREDNVIRNPGEDGGYAVSAARFSSDGRLIATAAFYSSGSHSSGTKNPHVKIWDRESGTVIRTIKGASSVDFDPTGPRMVMAVGQRAEIWDVESFKRVAVLVGPAQDIRVIAFSRDGSLVATGRDDGTIQLFDADPGREHLVLPGHACAISGLAFSSDGTKLASTDDCDDLQIWALDLDDLLMIARRKVTRPLTDEECLQYLHVEPSRCDER